LRYDVSIERSAELLRQALPRMARQPAALHPVSYAVWFEYVAGANPPLEAAVDAQLARAGGLDEEAVHALFERHVAAVDPEAARRVVDSLQRVLGGIAETTGSTGTHVGRFSASLGQLAAALVRGNTSWGIEGDPAIARNGPPPRLLADVVAEVIADTGTLRTQLGALQQRLVDGRREIDRLRDEVRRAREDALRDALTGLANRRGFDQALAACLLARTDAPAASGAPPAASRPPRAGEAQAPRRGPWLMLSDVDHFDRIGQAYGRAFGDEVLKTVAEALRGLVPHGSTVARMDGEAFALLVPELDAEGARALAERLRRHVGAARIHHPGRPEAERVTLSVGLAGHRAGEAAGELVARAGRALGQARREGRDRVACAD
jgi:diguanylate cyclase